MSEQRFTLAARAADTGEPGLIRKRDGSVWVVLTDGSEQQLSGGGSQPGVLQASLTLDSAQVLAIADAPVTIVPAVAGKIINPIGFTVTYIAGVTPYTDNSSGLSLYLNDAFNVDDVVLMAGIWDQAVSTTKTENPAKVGLGSTSNLGPNAVSDYADADLIVLCNANPTDGDGSLILTVQYQLLPVA